MSGGGTNLQAIFDAVENGTITNAEASVVPLEQQRGMRTPLERARKPIIFAAVCVSPKDYPIGAAFNQAFLKSWIPMRELVLLDSSL